MLMIPMTQWTGVMEYHEETPYQHPKYPKVTFWDLPGTGTSNFLQHAYLEMVEFPTYDFFIIFSFSPFYLTVALLPTPPNQED